MIFPHIQSALSFVLHNSVPLKWYDGNEADPICAHLCSWMQLLHIRREQKHLMRKVNTFIIHFHEGSRHSFKQRKIQLTVMCKCNGNNQKRL